MKGGKSMAGDGATGVLARPAKARRRARKMNRTVRKRFATNAARLAVFFCVVAILFFARPATAAELAILRNGFSIRHDHRLVMGTTTRLFLSTDDSSFTDVPTEEITGYEKDLLSPSPAESQTSISSAAHSAKSTPALNEVVNTASANYHLDPDLVNSVIHAESGFNVHAVSPKGARGLMQLMPGTASELGVNDSFDPQANVEGGSRYLRELLERYNFDLVKALAAYNAGPERVEQYQGVPPFRETRAYVARIVHDYNLKKTAQEKEAKQKQASAKPSSHAQKAAKPAATDSPAASPR
jgi:soluble lytic murein transglycosylase-like protein